MLGSSLRVASAVAFLVATCLGGSVIEKRAPAPFSTFTKNEFFKPAANANLWGTLYARSLQLPDESLLMTWEDYSYEPPLISHPIYRSVDGGATWSNFSQIKDTQNGWGMRFQPFLYTLPVNFGGFAAGTILAAGVSTPQSLCKCGTYIELYASTDQAKTWKFVSHIAYGEGPNTVKDGDAALWEPFLMMYNNQLVVYFSDQRDPAHSQKLSHVTTSDLRTWSSAVDDVVDPQYKGRPGMATVAYIASKKQYIMTYELCGTDNCAGWQKISSNPLNFNAVAGNRIVANDANKTLLGNSPYIIWTPNPNKSDGSGLLLASGNPREEVFVNDDNADPNNWRMVNINHWSAYSRSLRIVTIKGQKRLFVGNGGNFGPKENNGIACAVVPIPT